jgi:hypothetical protein
LFNPFRVAKCKSFLTTDFIGGYLYLSPRDFW